MTLVSPSAAALRTGTVNAQCAKCGKHDGATNMIEVFPPRRSGTLGAVSSELWCGACWYQRGNPPAAPTARKSKPAPASEPFARGVYASPEAAEERAAKVRHMLGREVFVSGNTVYPDAPIVPGFKSK